MTQPVKFYYNLLSQPCRALYMFFEASKIPYEPIFVNLKKGEHMTDEFKENVNRFQRVPAINDKGFKLAESVAIFRYICREKLVPDHWYPRDSVQRAKVDEYLEWQHNNLRSFAAMYFLRTFYYPKLFNKPVSPDTVNKWDTHLNNCLDVFEEHWARENQYLVGNKISFADLLAICEVDQPKSIGFDPFRGRPKLASWHQLVKESMEPYYEQANVEISKIASLANNPKLQVKL